MFWLTYFLSPRLTRRRMLQLKLDEQRMADAIAVNNAALESVARQTFAPMHDGPSPFTDWMNRPR